jgi:MFS transporter, FHS family, Na+ dependent glucose transporter 1
VNSVTGRTFGYYLLFICLGLGAAVIGPTLPTLASQTHTLLEDMGLLFLVGAGGYTLGTMLGGRIFDRLPGHRILGIAQLVVAGLLVLIPTIPWFGLLLGVLASKGLADGLINTGTNTLLVWTHKEKTGPYLNGLHFFFGLGAFLAPFLVAKVAGQVGGYRWAYWTLAAFGTLVGLCLLTIPDSPRPAQHQREAPQTTHARVHFSLAIAAALFLFFYVGAEVAFAGWIYTYAVTLQLASASGAAYLTSGFWLSFTVGRLISIPLAIRFTPPQIIWAALLSCLTIVALLISFPNSRGFLWVVVVGLGFSMAPLWASGFTLAGQSFHLTARVSSLILLGDSFGGMILPWLVGQVLGLIGPVALAYLVFGSLVGNLLAFVAILRSRPVAQPLA